MGVGRGCTSANSCSVVVGRVRVVRVRVVRVVRSRRRGLVSPVAPPGGLRNAVNCLTSVELAGGPGAAPEGATPVSSSLLRSSPVEPVRTVELKEGVGVTSCPSSWVEKCRQLLDKR